MGVADFVANEIAKKLNFKPTTCQATLFSELGAFLMAPADESWLFLISGYAGTGKTTAISAFIKQLQENKNNFVLIAPTGRSAKVLANYTGMSAKTIHKQIYRQKSLKDEYAQFSLDINKHKNTIFIVDEASLITTGGGYSSAYGSGNSTSGSSIFGSGDLLDDLIMYVKSNEGNKLILMGDPAQLPPIGLEKSPALDEYYLQQYTKVSSVFLTTVVRQERESGILYNATKLRQEIESNNLCNPQFEVEEFEDFRRIGGGELIEEIGDAFDKFTPDEVVILCRSNNRANRYNMGIRERVLYREEQLTRGDKVMVVKNCYQFLEEVKELDFIANGDVAQLESINKYEERYGLHFASATLSFPDYNNIEIDAKIILDTLTSVTPSLDQQQQRELFLQVYEDYDHIHLKKKRLAAVREDIYYNALQIKYAAAITGHKSQGGQWKCVFVDNSLWNENITLDDKKWLYTAITRGVERVYLVNFNDKYFL